MRNGNGSYGMEEWHRYNGTAQWNGNGRMAMEWWKLGIMSHNNNQSYINTST